MGFFDLFKSSTSVSLETAHQNSSKPVRSFQEKTYYVVGTQYYLGAISSLARVNPDWKKSGAVLASEGKVMEKIFKTNYINKPVKLVPEPQNKHDKNAIKVIISGKTVGYISREDNRKVKRILTQHDVKFISSFISGGPYKVVSENGDAVTVEKQLSIHVKIGYV